MNKGKSDIPAEEIYRTARDKVLNRERLAEQELMVVSDKFIKKADAEEIRREIGMTKVGQMIFEDGQKEGRKEGRKEERILAVVNLPGFNIPEKKILERYSEEDLKEAKETLKAAAK